MNIKKWDIYGANYIPGIGLEPGKSKPVLIISEDAVNDYRKSVSILSIIPRKQRRPLSPNEVFLKASKYGLETGSIVLCNQIKTISKQSLSTKYGSVDDIATQYDILTRCGFNPEGDKVNTYKGQKISTLRDAFCPECQRFYNLGDFPVGHLLCNAHCTHCGSKKVFWSEYLVRAKINGASKEEIMEIFKEEYPNAKV